MGLTPSELPPSGRHHDNDHHDHDDDDDCRQSLTFHHRHFWLVVGEMLTSRSVRRERGGDRWAHIIDVAGSLDLVKSTKSNAMRGVI